MEYKKKNMVEWLTYRPFEMRFRCERRHASNHGITILERLWMKRRTLSKENSIWKEEEKGGTTNNTGEESEQQAPLKYNQPTQEEDEANNRMKDSQWNDWWNMTKERVRIQSTRIRMGLLTLWLRYIRYNVNNHQCIY